MVPIMVILGVVCLLSGAILSWQMSIDKVESSTLYIIMNITFYLFGIGLLIGGFSF